MTQTTPSVQNPPHPPGSAWRRAIKSLLRPLFLLLRALLRPILFRLRAYLLRPLQPMIDQVEATWRQLDALSRQLEAVTTTLNSGLPSHIETISNRVDGMMRDLAALRGALSSTDQQLAVARKQLTELADNLPTTDVLNSVDRLVVSLASRSDRG
jgi:hypothetical protein